MTLHYICILNWLSMCRISNLSLKGSPHSLAFDFYFVCTLIQINMLDSILITVLNRGSVFLSYSDVITGCFARRIKTT